MNTALTITRNFHPTRRHNGRQHLRPGPAPYTPNDKVPRISRLMALAIHCHELLLSGQFTNQSELARYAINPSQRRRIHRSAGRSGEQPHFSDGVATALKRISTMAGHSLGTLRAKRRCDQINGFVSVWQYTTAVVCRDPPIQHSQRGLSVSRHTQDLKGSSALSHNSAVRRTPELPTFDRSVPGEALDRSGESDVTPSKPVLDPSQLVAALAMITGLPMSNAEKADAVRRLLNSHRAEMSPIGSNIKGSAQRAE